MEKTLKSTAVVIVTPADWADANALRRAVLGVAKNHTISPDFVNMDMSALNKVLMDIATDPTVEAAVFACGKKVTYSGKPFNVALFDDPTMGAVARRDFFEVAALIVKENLAPFFETALSLLKKPQATGTESQK